MNSFSYGAPEGRAVPLSRPRKLAVLAAAVWALAGTVQPAGDDQPSDSLALVARARQVGDLRGEGSAPFRLQARIDATINKEKSSGEYLLLWQGRNRWREELKLGDFQRLRVGVDGGYQQVRSIDYQQQAVFDLDKAMDAFKMLTLSPQETAGSPQIRSNGAFSEACIEIEIQNYAIRELCFDPLTGPLVHSGPPSELHSRFVSQPVMDYSEFQTFGDKQVPLSIRVERIGWLTLQIFVTALEPAPGIDASLFAAPAHSEFWGDCREIVEPEPAHKTAPRYPMQARKRYQQGLVAFYARIEPDGSVSHLLTLNSPSALLEGAAREAVQTWTYKPLTCGGTPVRVETAIEVLFTLG